MSKTASLARTDQPMSGELLPAAGAALPEALELASAAANVVIHQVGTTGTARIPQLRQVVARPTESPIT